MRRDEGFAVQFGALEYERLIVGVTCGCGIRMRVLFDPLGESGSVN